MEAHINTFASTVATSATLVNPEIKKKESEAVMPEGEKHWGGQLVIGGDNLPSPSSNRVN